MKLHSQPYSPSEYMLRAASLMDAPAIHQVMTQASQTLEHKDFFICDNLEYVETILKENGFGIIACDTAGTVVGNLLVKYPGISEENLGYDVFIPNKKCTDIEEITKANSDIHCAIPLCSQTLEKVVLMDSASVLPNHQGHGLESRMIAFAESIIDKSKYHYAFATVAPNNIASLKSLQKNGYQIMLTKEKYGGLLRHIMMKKLS